MRRQVLVIATRNPINAETAHLIKSHIRDAIARGDESIVVSNASAVVLEVELPDELATGGVVPASAVPLVGDDVPPLVIPHDALEAIQSGTVDNVSPYLRLDEGIEIDPANPPADTELLGTWGGMPVFIKKDGGVPRVETPETKTPPGGSRCPRVVAVDLSRPADIPIDVKLGPCPYCGRAHFHKTRPPVERRSPGPNGPGVSFRPGGI